MEEYINTINNIDNIEEARKLATEANISFSGNTGLNTLKKKLIAECLKATNNEEEKEEEDEEEIQIAPALVKTNKADIDYSTRDPNKEPNSAIRRMIVRAKALKLVRVRITTLDPSEASVNGTFITVCNKYLNFTKYIPFGDETDNGYHVPNIIYKALKRQKFVIKKEIKNGTSGLKQYKTILANKYNVEVLPPLTKEELENLAKQQKASNSLSN